WDGLGGRYDLIEPISVSPLRIAPQRYALRPRSATQRVEAGPRDASLCNGSYFPDARTTLQPNVRILPRCTLLLGLDARFLRHLGKAGDFGLDQLAEGFGGGAGDELDGALGEPADELLVLEGPGDLGVELVQDLLRRAGGGEEEVEGHVLVAGEAGLGDGRDFGEEGRALGAGHGEAARL